MRARDQLSRFKRWAPMAVSALASHGSLASPFTAGLPCSRAVYAARLASSFRTLSPLLSLDSSVRGPLVWQCERKLWECLYN